MAPREIGVRDLTRLNNLDEKSILENLQVRFQNDLIYTYVGNILVAVNPYKLLGALSQKEFEAWRKKEKEGIDDSNAEPHIFDFTANIYRNMLKTSCDQSVVISGESGAGKTESANYILNCLSSMSGNASAINQQIIASSELLEAFGNAKTIRNRNSSRFGKFIFIKFSPGGKIRGATITSYLLEKSRITSRSANERTYHIFLYLLEGASPEEKGRYKLLPFDQYNYLAGTEKTTPGIDDAHSFQKIKDLMMLIGLNEEDQESYFSILSAILLMGNIIFAESDTHEVVVKNPDVLETAAALLGLSPSELATAFTTKSTLQQQLNEVITVKLNINQTMEGRDSLAKNLYERLWLHLLQSLNKTICDEAQGEDDNENHYHIGVLDIFGFENFPCNSFEQLCINFANERLHQFFNHNLFQLEQEDYKSEGIDWTYVEFVDNKDCIELLTLKPIGIFHLIDESCLLQTSTDAILLEKISSSWKTHDRLVKPATSVKTPSFAVRHYAAEVTYQVAGFIAKNQDSFHQDLTTCLKTSRNTLVNLLYATDLENNTGNQPPRGGRRISLQKDSAMQAALLAVRESAAAGTLGSPSGSNSNNGSPRSSLAPPSPANAGANPKLPHRPSIIRTSSSPVGLTSPASSSATLPPPGSSSGAKGVSKATETSTLPSKKTTPQTPISPQPSEVKTPEVKSKTVSRKGPRTVGNQYLDSLEELMFTLEGSNCYYVCCLKPNDQQVSDDFSQETTLRQLRYLGLAQTVKIRRQGFALRMHFQEFMKRYWILNPRGVGYHPKIKMTQKHCQTLLASLGHKEMVEWQVGKTKVFIKHTLQHVLDQMHDSKMARYVVTLQARAKATVERKKYLRAKMKITMVQQWYRKCLAKKRFKARLSTYRNRIENEQRVKDEQRKLLELKEAALLEKKKEREMIKKGLRKIDEQEAHVDPRDVLMVRLQSRMLSELTNLDFLRMRYIFTFSGKKGMDRIGFTKFIWEISRFKPINFESDFQLTDEQETVITSLFQLFDKDRDGKVHLRDIIGFLAILILGKAEDKLEQGFPFFDPDGYGDFSKDNLNTVISNLVKMMQTPPQLPPTLFNINVPKDKSSYLQIHFDTNIIGNSTSLYTTILASNAMRVPDIILLTCEKKGFAGEKENCTELYSLYEVRYQGSKIIYQRRLDSKERPMEIHERWGQMSTAEYMRFILTKNPSQIRRQSTKSRPKHVVDMTFGRNTSIEVSALPFVGDDDCVGRGFVTIYYQADHKTTERHGTRSIEGHVYKNLAIDTSINTMDLIEIFLHKNRMEKQKKADFLLYMIRVDASHHIIYERPLDGADIPLALMAMTGSEDPCRFLLVEQGIILQKPLANGASTLRQVNCYLENPASSVKITKMRTHIDYIALKRLAFDEQMSAEDMKEKFFEASHATGFPSEYELHLVQATEDKKLIYERILISDERVLQGIGVKQKKGAAPLVTQFLMVRKPTDIVHPSVAIRSSIIDNDMKKSLEVLKQKDFAEELCEAAFAGNDGYMNKEAFIKVGMEHEWIRDFFSLQAIFKRNKFIRVAQFE